VADGRCVELMLNGDSFWWCSGWRVINLPFLVNCFLLPECRVMKLHCTHFHNKCTVPLLLNPCKPGVWYQMLGVASSGFMKVRHLDSHMLLAKSLNKDTLLLVAVHSHSIKKKDVPPYTLCVGLTS
jgi:hypothetical protein